MIEVTGKNQSVGSSQASVGSFVATVEAFGEGSASVEDVVDVVKRRSSLQLLDGERGACASVGRMAVQQRCLLSSHNEEPLQLKVPASVASLMLGGVTGVKLPLGGRAEVAGEVSTLPRFGRLRSPADAALSPLAGRCIGPANKPYFTIQITQQTEILPQLPPLC